MDTLSHDLLDSILRPSVAPAWDDFDLERDLERRRDLRSAALVHRSWTRHSIALLCETIVIRRLDDFAALERAGPSLENVRTLVLDDSDGRDGEEAAWRAFEAENGGPVDRTDQAVINAWGGHKADAIAQTLVAFSTKALDLVQRLPQLREVRSTHALTFARIRGRWPIQRLAIESRGSAADDGVLEALWTTLAGWDTLRALTIGWLGDFENDETGLPPIPAELSERLCELRLGARGEPGATPVPGAHDDGGLRLVSRLFAGPTPHLHLLDLRFGAELVADGDSQDGDEEDDGRPWPALIFGHADAPGYVPPSLERLTCGWSCHAIGPANIGVLIAALPASLAQLPLVARWSLIGNWESLRPGSDILGTLADALSERGHVVGLVRLDLDLAGFARTMDDWRADDRWTALQATCDERGVALDLLSMV